MNDLTDTVKLKIDSLIKIYEYENERDLINHANAKVLLRTHNDIHPENASILVARGIANRINGSIFTLNVGTGGATIDPLGNITFATPNTSGVADINSPVYFEVVDDNRGAPSGNQMSVRHINGTLFSDVEIRMVIDKNEPFGQSPIDSTGINVNTSSFVFDEIGLKTEDGLLVTHAVFSPIEKSANRIIEIVYTLRVRIVS